MSVLEKCFKKVERSGQAGRAIPCVHHHLTKFRNFPSCNMYVHLSILLGSDIVELVIIEGGMS
jgi:hypothetical protein